MGINLNQPCLVKHLLDKKFVYQGTTEAQVCMRDYNYELLKSGYIFQKKVKKSEIGPIPAIVEYFEVICIRGGIVGRTVSTERITEPHVIMQILKTCFPKFSELEDNLNCMFNKLANIGIYDEFSTKFEHEDFYFVTGKYQINRKFAMILQHENYLKAKDSKNFDPLKFNAKYNQIPWKIGTLSINKTKLGSNWDLERIIFESSMDQLNVKRGPEFYYSLLDAIGALDYYPFPVENALSE